MDRSLIVNDDLLWLIPIGSALLFSTLTFQMPFFARHKVEGVKEDIEEIDTFLAIGRSLQIIKVLLYPGLAAVFWWIASILSFTLSNCTPAFSNSCFTSPTYASTTTQVASIWANAFGVTFGFLGFLFIIFVIYVGITYIRTGIFALLKQMAGMRT